MKCEEAQELITALIDEELSVHESSLIKAHLVDCPNCKRIYSLEQWLKSVVRDSAMSIHAPSEQKEKILCPQRQPRSKAWFSNLWKEAPRISSFVAQAAAIVALFALPVLVARYWMRSPYFPIAPGVFQSYTQITKGEIVPITTRNVTEVKERLARAVNGRFAPMAYDFSMMELWPVGGLFQEIANRQVLVTVYEGKGLNLICYTFLGSEDDAPAIATVFFDAEKRMNFYQFSYGQTNAVMHREGEVMCILVSQMPMNELLALARSKAYVS